MTHRFSVFIVLSVFSVCLLLSSCSAPKRQPDARSVLPSTMPVTAAEAPHAPDDPSAAKPAQPPVLVHVDKEEEQRQLGFDRERINEHRAVIKLITAARARYESAHDESALKRIGTEMHSRITEIQRRLARLEQTGDNSRLRADYAALEAILTDAYEPAKLAAIHGQPHALEEISKTFDEHLEKIDVWLEEAAESEQE